MQDDFRPNSKTCIIISKTTKTHSKNHWKVTSYPVTQVLLENSDESHWKFSEISLETSENLPETS